MKKIIFLLFCVSLFASCIKDVSNIDEEPAAEAPDVTHFLTTEEFTVPVKEGYVTQVMVGGEIIAEAVTPMTILLPRTVQTKAESGPQLVYVPLNEYPNNVEPVNNFKLYQVVCFEDSREGDYDYNDLVIHVLYKLRGNKFGFAVQPVALGSTKSIKLGCSVYKGNTLIYKNLVTPEGKDCREQYFKSQAGFINTQGKEANQQMEHYFLASSIRNWDISKIAADGPMRVEWYIEVDHGAQLYALSTDHINQSFDKNGIPYGLVITHTGHMYEDRGELCGFDWFNYPSESHSIADVYPGLWEWMTSPDRSYNFFKDVYNGNIVAEGAFPASDLGLFVSDDADVFLGKYQQN